jgi:chorismate mutase
MNRRLELMHDVARWKWNEQKPVSDPNREAELLDRLVHQGAEYELPADTLRDFFQAQMDGSKQIQQADFDHWKAEQQLKFENVPDLINDLRPKITELSAQLLASLEELHTEFGQQPFSKLVTEQAKTILTADGITAEVRETVLRPLLSPAAVEPAQ